MHGQSHLKGPNLGSKVDDVVYSSLLSRGEQHFLVNREGLHTDKGFLDGGCTAGARGEEEAPPPLQQGGLCGVLHIVFVKSCTNWSSNVYCN